ncbi:MAG: L,D-transpeptidase family protein [Smithella sp.]
MFSLSPAQKLKGTIKTYTVKEGESLIEIARKFDLGYNAIIEANPGIDPFVPEEGITVTIPSRWILPYPESRVKIIINLSEFRLYYFFKKNGLRFVETFPLGIGSEGHETPIGVFKITAKITNPAWRVPKSIRLEDPNLPNVVPPGPDNPLGTHALRLSNHSILIHGTNRPFAVGRMNSHGCLRLYPVDMTKLFKLVSKCTPVTIVRQPIKVAVQTNRVYMEVHNDPYAEVTLQDAANLLIQRGLLGRANIQKMREVLRKKDGIPTDITE